MRHAREVLRRSAVALLATSSLGKGLIRRQLVCRRHRRHAFGGNLSRECADRETTRATRLSRGRAGDKDRSASTASVDRSRRPITRLIRGARTLCWRIWRHQVRTTISAARVMSGSPITERGGWCRIGLSHALCYDPWGWAQLGL